MQKNMKKLVSALGAIAFVATAFGVANLDTQTANAETESLKIAGKTLTVSNNVNVSFLVPVEAGNKDEITVKVAESDVDGEYVTLTATAKNYEDNDGAKYYEFIYKGVMAYEMANDLYAYAEMGAEKSETVKYSVLQYAYTKLGMAKAEKDTTEGLDTLLNAMLSYGSAAAQFNGTDVDYLNDYTYVSIANATFDDGFAYGLFKKGETVNVNVNTGYKLDDVNGVFTQDGDLISFVVPEEKFIDDTSFVVDAGITADQKIIEELAKIEINAPQSVEQNETFTLPDTNVEYEGVTVEWSVTNATLNGNVVAFDKVGTATITVSVSCDGGETQTKFVEVTVNAHVLQEVTKTLSFATKDNRTVFTSSQQVWKQNDVTVTNNKGSSTSNVGDYANPARFYKSSDFIVEFTGVITVIVVDCNTASYATSLQKSAEAAGLSVTVNNDKVTITLSGDSDKCSFALKDGQIRIDSITVTGLI